MKLKVLITISSIAFLTGCGGGGSESPVVEVIAGLSAPEGAELITDNSASSSGLAFLNYAAFTDAGTDYSKAKAYTHIDSGEADKPMKMVDMILCYLDNSRITSLVNQNYLATMDKRNCKDSSRSNPDMANVIIQNTRADNSSNHIAKLSFENRDTIVRGDVTLIKSPTESEPYGAMEMNFSRKEPSNLIEDGSLTINNIGDKVSLEFVSTEDYRLEAGSGDNSSTPYDDRNFLMYIDSYISTNGSTGMAKVGFIDNVDSSIKVTHKLNWNDSYIAQYDYDSSDTLTASSCKSRTSYDDYAKYYTLYDTDGKKIDITTYVYGFYTDANNDPQRAYIGKRGAWFSGEETGTNRPTTITTRAGDSLSIEYDVDDTSNWDTDRDGVFATISGITLDDYIRFDSGIIAGDKVVYNDNTTEGTIYSYQHLGYSGNYFWGIPWVTVNGKTIRKLNIKDGTLITDHNGINYIVKQRIIKKTPVTVDASNCSNLTTNAVDNESNITSKTSADIRAVDANWVTPSVGTDPKVIDGVIQ